MTAPRFETFEEFWPYYVLEHAKKTTRRFHFAGTSAVIASVAMGVLSRKARWIALAPVFGYGPAWISHLFIENNRPATFDYPLWSARADFVMYAKMLNGTMDAEVEAAQAARDEAEAEAAAAVAAENAEATVETEGQAEADMQAKQAQTPAAKNGQNGESKRVTVKRVDPSLLN